ncbi:MAG: EamA family transporter [Ilumatobacteraceae bacterium]|nr:EamA family transporter [Ilumatobacteraceae bacterium]
MTPQNRSKSFFDTAPPEIFFLFSAAAQYTGAVVAVKLFDEVHPATVALFRVISGAVFLVLFSLRANHPRWTRRDLMWAGMFGVSTALMNVFFYWGIDRLPLGKSVAIEFIGPIVVAAVRTKSVRNSWALGLATLGVVVLGGVELNSEPLGLLFIFIASIMWALYIVLGSVVARSDRGVAGLGVGLLIGAFVLMPVGVSGAGVVLTTPRLLLACIVVGATSSALGYGIDQAVLRRIPVRRFSVMLALLPVTAAIFGVIFLDQNPTLTDLLGMVLVLAGVGMQERDELDQQPEVAQIP